MKVADIIPLYDYPIRCLKKFTKLTWYKQYDHDKIFNSRDKNNFVYVSY